MTDVPCNRVTWFQIPAHDLHRAHALYRSVVGCEPEDAVEEVKMSSAVNGGIAEPAAEPCTEGPDPAKGSPCRTGVRRTQQAVRR